MKDHGALSERGLGWAVAVGVLLVLVGAFGPSAAFGQVIENPARPKAANAGRVIVPEEALAISDVGTNEYFFKMPGLLRPAPDGSLALRDEGQILLFDPAGKFIHNFFKKGQGPGEMSYAGALLPTEKSLIVHSAFPGKLIFFDYSGRYVREIKVGTLPGSKRALALIILDLGGEYILDCRDFADFKGGEAYFAETTHRLLAMSEATGEVRDLTTFPTRIYALAAPGGGGASYDVTALIAVPFKKTHLALTHTEDYRLKIFDPAANRVIREFRRAYERVKPAPLTEAQRKGGAMVGDKPFRPPVLDYENDVKNILTRDGEIWAITSTKDKAKGVLIDVFDGEGVYRDCFFLKLPEAAIGSIASPGRCALDGEYLWVVEQGEDETFSIRKYRVLT